MKLEALEVVYADTDFFLAIFKKEDWLKSRAEKQYKELKGKLETSIVTVLELAILCRKKGLDPEEVMAAVFEISRVERITLEEALQAAYLMKNKGFTAFDSFHAVLSKERAIISSDAIFE